MNIVHYIISFTVYTLAMSGLIALALFVYKKVTDIGTTNKKTKSLTVEETLNIGPRKTLMIAKAGNERFLIVSDVDKTTLISKLSGAENIIQALTETNANAEQMTKKPIVDLEKVKKSIDKENINTLFPKKLKKADKKSAKTKQDAPEKEEPINTKNQIHLEVISNKNPKGTELRKQRSYMQTRRRNVTIEVGEIKDHGFSTIKELVHKVNEI